MTPSYFGIPFIPDVQLATVRGGMFGPFVNRPFAPETFTTKPPVPQQPPVTEGLGRALAKGAVMGVLTGAAAGNPAAAAVGGALLGGMDHCMDPMPPLGQSPIPTNLNTVSRVDPCARSLLTGNALCHVGRYFPEGPVCAEPSIPSQQIVTTSGAVQGNSVGSMKKGPGYPSRPDPERHRQRATAMGDRV